MKATASTVHVVFVNGGVDKKAEKEDAEDIIENGGGRIHPALDVRATCRNPGESSWTTAGATGWDAVWVLFLPQSLLSFYLYPHMPCDPRARHFQAC